MCRASIIFILFCTLFRPLSASDSQYGEYLRSTPRILKESTEIIWSSDSSGLSRKKSRIQRTGLNLYLFSRLVPVSLIEFNTPDKAGPYRVSSATVKLSGLGGSFIYSALAEKELRRQESVARQNYAEWPLRPETVNDTLQQVEAYLRDGFRIHAEPLKIGFRKTSYTLRGTPLFMHSTSAKVAREQARLLKSESENLFQRSERLRRAYMLSLMSTIALTAGAGIYEKRNGHREKIDRLFIPFTYVLHLCTIPLRMGAERSFRRGVLTLNRELQKRYPLADAYYSAK